MSSPASNIDDVATEKVSITLDEEILAELRERVGPGGLSSYINRTLRAGLQRERVKELLDEAAARSGPVPQEMLDDARAALWRE